MRAVGIRLLKKRLREYLRLVKRGETVLVVERDQVVAELAPPREGRSPFLADARFAKAVHGGWITPPELVGAGPPPRLPVVPLKQLLGELETDREDR